MGRIYHRAKYGGDRASRARCGRKSVIFFTSDKGGGTCFCPCLFVCLSVCLLARLLKNAWMDLDEMSRVDRCRDVDELINFWARWIIIPEPDCFLRYRIDYGILQPWLRCQPAALLCGILRLENPTYTYWRRTARASRGFKMVLLTELSDNLCQR